MTMLLNICNIQVVYRAICSCNIQYTLESSINIQITLHNYIVPIHKQLFLIASVAAMEQVGKEPTLLLLP